MGARITIAGRQYDFFNKINIDLKYGYSASTFSFSANFDPESAAHRRIFRPLNYSNVNVFSSLGERLITGTILGSKFVRSAEQRLSTINGYSLTGVLSDCQIPIESYPLHYTNVTFAELGRRLLSFFNLGFVAENDGGVSDEIIEEITAKTNITVFQFLSEIAAQRNLILTHDNLDNLVATRPNVNSAPVAHFRQSIPATEISLDVNGQNVHSSITTLKQADIENDNASEATITNTLVNAFRPTVTQQNVGNDVTVEQAASNVRANELRNIRLKITTDRWEWLRNGSPETMQPNNIISVTSPDNFIFNRTNFFVESVQLKADNDKETAILNCVPPQVYNNQNPSQLF